MSNLPRLTIRILDGADRGRVFSGMQPPISLGREEGNSIQLNDERVSRFHAKIQWDHGDLVITDLESTNGTKVNGEQTQLRILRQGDTVSLGRSTLLVGSREEIQKRVDSLKKPKPDPSFSSESSVTSSPKNVLEQPELQLRQLEQDPPGIPERLTPGQAAKMVEMLEFLHLKLRRIIQSAEISQQGEMIAMGQAEWQSILDLQARIAAYLRAVGRPDE